jgi:gamma-glutamyltranspeptidase/glutathione hydrolase/leukotriene-C4 hydrolase
VWSLVRCLQRIVEAFKHAYAMRTKMGDPDFLLDNKDFLKLMHDLRCPEYASKTGRSLARETTFKACQYGADVQVTMAQEAGGTAQVCVVAPDGSAVSVTSSINL